MKGIYTKLSYYEETFKSGNIELKYHHYQTVSSYICCSFKLASDVGHLRNLPSVCAVKKKSPTVCSKLINYRMTRLWLVFDRLMEHLAVRFGVLYWLRSVMSEVIL